MDKKSVKVKILDSEYALKADAESEYLHKLAAYVDQKMQKLGESANINSHLKIAVLTALNLADELFRLKEKHSKLVIEIEKTSDKITENLDSYLNHFTN